MNVKDVENYIFMQDKAPCHRATKTTKFLDYNNIELLDWPGYFPDLNQIEKIWSWIKDEIY